MKTFFFVVFLINMISLMNKNKHMILVLISLENLSIFFMFFLNLTLGLNFILIFILTFLIMESLFGLIMITKMIQDFGSEKSSNFNF